MMHQTALDQYKATRVETGSAERLIVLLYEGALRFCQEAEAAIDRGDIAARTTALTKASRIVQELSSALDHEAGGDLAGSLEALYDFVDHKLTLANVENQAQHIHEGAGVLETLLGSWRRLADGEVAETADPVAASPEPAPTLSLSA